MFLLNWYTSDEGMSILRYSCNTALRITLNDFSRVAINTYYFDDATK